VTIAQTSKLAARFLSRKRSIVVAVLVVASAVVWRHNIHGAAAALWDGARGRYWTLPYGQESFLPFACVHFYEVYGLPLPFGRAPRPNDPPRAYIRSYWAVVETLYGFKPTGPGCRNIIYN
jgi:hypothetical protein